MIGGHVVILAILAVVSTAAAAPQTVAIFDEPGFPIFAGSRDISPRVLAIALEGAGVRTDLLNATELAQRDALSARRHVALISLCGNTFPRAAARNIERYHRGGGCLLVAGVPFCHECVRAGPVRWTRVAAGDDRLLQMEGAGRDGSNCLRVIHGPTSPWAGATSTRVAASAGERFVVGGWVKTEGETGADPADRLYVRFFDAADTFITQSGPALPGGQSEWEHIQVEATAPENASAADVCLAVFSRGSCTADDLSLRRAAGETELITNGGFEDQSSVWIDLGHTNDLLGHDAIGAGGFLVRPTDGRFVYSPTGADPLRVDWITWPEAPPGPQAVLDPDSFPPEDEVIGVVGRVSIDGAHQGHSVAVIRHHCARFAGATDVWLGYPAAPPPQGYQIAMAATAMVLQERGVLDEAGAERVRAAARRMRKEALRKYHLPPGEAPRDHILPKSPSPARRLLVTSLNHLSPEMQLTLRALQGLVNRAQPTIYVADRWLPDLQEEGFAVERVADPRELLARFRDAYEGAALYDPAEGATGNIAVMLAALKGQLPATQRVARDLGLEVKTDLRGRFRDDAEAYAWAREELLEQCNPHVVCHIKQAEPLGVAGAELSARLADYLVAHRIFCFHLRREFTPHERLGAERILASFPAHTPVIGYFGPEPGAAPDLANEWEIVDITSALAKDFVFLVNGNLSVHSGLPTPTLSQTSRPLPELRDDRVYVSWYLSDGDSPSTWYRMANHWDDDGRGSLPLGWSLGPATIDVCPLPLARFYRQATQMDCFVNSCSGAGYIYPDRYGVQVADGDGLLDAFIRRSGEFMRRCDLGVLNAHHHPSIRDATLDRMADGVPGLQGMIAGYGKCADEYAHAHRLSPGGTPVFRCLTTGMGLNMSHDEVVEALHKELLAAVPEERPAFIQAFAIYWFTSPSDVKLIADRLGPEFEFVRPDELAALYSRWRARQR